MYAGGMNVQGCEALVGHASDVTEDAVATTYIQECNVLARISKQGVECCACWQK